MSKKKQAHFQIRKIEPLTAHQEKAFESYKAGNNLVLHGFSGTGKTFLSLYLGLNDVIKGDYDQMIIMRSVVPTREMGFLPGSITEKTRIFEEPYQDICDDLFERGDGYDILKNKEVIKFTTTSYLRGLTFDNSIVIVDEMQNMSFHECYTIMTRIGLNSRIIFCGDFRQTDLTDSREKEGLRHFLAILKRLKNSNFDYIDFVEDDIVRSDLVKQFIIESTHYMKEHNIAA